MFNYKHGGINIIFWSLLKLFILKLIWWLKTLCSIDLFHLMRTFLSSLIGLEPFRLWFRFRKKTTLFSLWNTQLCWHNLRGSLMKHLIPPHQTNKVFLKCISQFVYWNTSVPWYNIVTKGFIFEIVTHGKAFYWLTMSLLDEEGNQDESLESKVRR